MSEKSSQTKQEVKPVSLKFKTQSDRDKLFALAAVKGKPASTLAREIVLEYLSKHAEEIRAAQTAGETYQQTIAEIRQSAASPEHAARQKSVD